MRKPHYLVAAMATVAAVLAVFAPQASATHGDDGSVIVDWNQLAQKQITGQPFSQVRQYAMMHIAMADAVIAIEGRYEPFLFEMRAYRGASSKAAAAQAAHDVLAHFVPGGLATFDDELAGDLVGIPPGPRALGVQVGKKAAAWVIALRANDGAAAADPNPALIEPSTLPGIWRQTFSGRATFSNWGNAEPFALLSPTQFLPDVHPQLESAGYATDFNEVKNGSRPIPLPATADLYTTEQRTALLWAGGNASGTLRTLPGVATPFVNVTNAFRLWHNVARDVGQAERYSLLKMARLFALLTVSMHDSVQTSQASKFIYRLWRPETAIVEADLDSNSSTVADASWVPLLITPPYPSHSSNMTCIGAGAARMLGNVFGTDAKTFNAVWYKDNSTAPAVVFSKTVTSFKALAVEQGNSRVWGGIHFRFELDTSHEACEKVADYIFDHKMQSDPFPFRW